MPKKLSPSSLQSSLPSHPFPLFCVTFPLFKITFPYSPWHNESPRADDARFAGSVLIGQQRVNAQQTFWPKLPPAFVQKPPTGTKILLREATPFHMPKLYKQQPLCLGSSLRRLTSQATGVEQHTSSRSVRTSLAALRYVCKPRELFIFDRPLFLLHKNHGVAEQ